MTAFAKGYDFFNYYMTLVLTPMFILSGVFYPVSSLPAPLQTAVQMLPLTHAVDLVRPLIAGQPVTHVTLHLAVLAAYAVTGFAIAAVLIRRRLLV
jgi:lipooligosaccharide transport system permease protein